MSAVEMFAKEVAKELTEMKKLGSPVPDGAMKRVEDMDEMAEYEESMSVSDCADLLISLG